MNEKVILINLPPASNYSYENVGRIYPATGILLIGTIMKNRGIKVKVIDGTIVSDYEKRTLDTIDKDTIMIGFSVMTSQVPMALNLSKLIKTKYPDIPIIWGGIHPILFPEQTISDPNIDIVVIGEGSKTALDLIDYTERKINLEQIKGIGFKDKSGGIILTKQNELDDINKLPHIDYSILDDIEIYLKTESIYQREIATDNNESLRIAPILTGLGCCYKCQFCINVFLKRRYRFRKAESIIEEIKRLQGKYNINAFVFLDEDFLINKNRLLEFLDLIEKENLKFYWRIWSRTDYFREDYLNRGLILRMEENGLRSLVMGGESGSQRILDSIQKEIDVKSIPYSAHLLKETAITPRYSFVIGFDKEKKEDLFKTYELCIRLININHKVDIAGPFIFRYYPGSPIFDRIIKKYKIEIPQKLEDWKNALSAEGYLKIEKMPWIWSGFAQTANFLNRELKLFSKLYHINNIVSYLIRWLIRWRIKNSYIWFPLPERAYAIIKRLYRHYLNRNSILLVHASESPQSVLRYIEKPCDWKWIYLGRHFLSLIKWKEGISNRIHHLVISRQVQKTAWNLRRPFLDLMAELGKRYNSLDWWVSQISERNTMVSPLFLNCCYLQLVSEILDKREKNLCVVAESMALLDSIEKQAKNRGYQIQWSRLHAGWRRFVKSRQLRRAARIIKYCISNIPYLWKTFYHNSKKNFKAAYETRSLGQPLPFKTEHSRILFFTFINESCFGSNGQFKEKYWGRLPSWLMQQGYDIVFIPYLFNIERTIKEAMAWLRQSNNQFLIPEDYYRFSDYLASFLSSIRQFLIPRGTVFLDSLDITLLVAEEKVTRTAIERAINCNMYYRLIRRLAKANFQIDRLYHVFENHILEKALILGLRRFFPMTKIIGFQHTIFFPFELSCFISQGEQGIAPLADRIVCSSPFFKDKLVEEGLPLTRVTLGCALPYEYLQTLATEDKIRATTTGNNILVALPLVANAAIELTYKTLCAFKDESKFTILIKPHPQMQFVHVKRALGLKEIPSHFKIIDGLMKDWFPRTKLVISTGTAAVYEALAMGIPVLRVGRETNLDFDPLMWLPEYQKTYCLPEEIRQRAIGLLSMDKNERKELREFGAKLIQKYFAPVTEEGLRNFLP